MARGPGDPRVRYIAVRVQGNESLSRRGLIDAIRATGRRVQGEDFEQETGIWLTRYKHDQAIIRCHHTHTQSVRALLEQVENDTAGDPLSLTPIATSGTIRALTEKHVPGLKETPGEARRRRANTQQPRKHAGNRNPRTNDKRPRRGDGRRAQGTH